VSHAAHYNNYAYVIPISRGGTIKQGLSEGWGRVIQHDLTGKLDGQSAADAPFIETSRNARSHYSKQFGTESSYRLSEQAIATTTTRDATVNPGSEVVTGTFNAYGVNVRYEVSLRLLLLYYHSSTMKYANVSVKFPKELDAELERFLDETGVYTNKSEFIKEAVRRHLVELNNEPAISALRIEQLLTRAEQESTSNDELQDRLEDLRQRVDDEAVAEAVETARQTTGEEYTEQT
jgi:Arc/MetJ-type ribon-helix-helix transcriptional regulator